MGTCEGLLTVKGAILRDAEPICRGLGLGSDFLQHIWRKCDVASLEGWPHFYGPGKACAFGVWAHGKDFCRLRELSFATKSPYVADWVGVSISCHIFGGNVMRRASRAGHTFTGLVRPEPLVYGYMGRPSDG